MIIHGMNGYPAKVDQDGRLHVEANITATGVTIKDAADGAKKLTINGDGSINVVLTGSKVELLGLATNRPAANTVDPGTTYWSVDTGDVSVSTGSTWRSIGVV